MLSSNGVEYLLIGGYAVGHYGYVRNTKDMDVWVSMRADNAQRLSAALVQFGFPPAAVPSAALLEPEKILRMGNPPNRIEILTTISGLSFDDCWGRRVQTEIDGLLVNVISLEDLRVNKRASGRPQDLADLDQLP